MIQISKGFKAGAICCAALITFPVVLMGQANMRRDGALTLVQTSDDNHGFYAATIDPDNGFAYFAAKYVYKVNISTPLPVQVGPGINIGKAYSGAMDPSAGCVYFDVGSSIYQILANGTNSPSPGSTMASPFGTAVFLTQMLIDTSDPANHYLYVMTEAGGTSSTLYKIALNGYPNFAAIVGSATTTVQQPALGYGVIDLTNRCAYFGSYIPTTESPYVAKFALGTGTAGPTNLGGVYLDAATNRSVGGMALDVSNGFGYCASDGSDSLFGHGRIYKWALNGTGTPTLVSYVDMHTNEGWCHVAAIKPDDGLLYFASDLSYPLFVYRFRLPAGTNAPVETGNLPLLGTTNSIVPAWGTNPTNSSNWGEVFARSIVYDSVRDFIYIGRDCADAQLQPYTDQIVKIAPDRDEALVALTEDGANTNNTIPYSESFESYSNGFSLIGTNGWFGEDSQMAVVTTNNYAGSYGGIFPVSGSHQLLLQVDGSVTNRFGRAANSNVWVDFIMEGKYWTDPILTTLSNTPFALCVTTNGHLAVWNCTNPPLPGNGWTELTDTSIPSGQFVRITLDADYSRDSNGEFYYRVFLNGTPSLNPETRYATADTNQNYFGDFLAQGRFALDDLVVATPTVSITAVAQSLSDSVSLRCRGMPGLSHRIWTTTSLTQPSWQPISTNVAGADGSWQVTDTLTGPARFYRATLP